MKSSYNMGNLINGTWKGSEDPNPIVCRSPIDQSVVGTVPRCTEKDIDQIMSYAKNAQTQWESANRTYRADILKKTASLLRSRADTLIPLLTLEIAKTYAEAKDEVFRSADMIDAFAHTGLFLSGDMLRGDGYPGSDRSRVGLVEKIPHGIVLAMPPFNYPINLAVAKIAPALMMGNAVVVKPPTHGALSCLSLLHCFSDAGVPAGVIQSITGEGKTIGIPLVKHPDVGMVAFTGSSAVGMLLAQHVGMIPLLFECGGNNAAIVCADADVDLTATEIVKGGFSYSGQRCTAINYILAEKHVHDMLIPKMIEKIQKIYTIGDPRNQDVNFGPLINEKEAIHIEKRVKQSILNGSRCVIGGKRNGCLYEPTILRDVSPSDDIVKDEVFGPVVSCVSLSSTEEMVSMINASAYGLQTSVFTTDLQKGLSLSQALRVGSVMINSRPQRGPDHFPFTGIRTSGIGTQSIRDTLLAMTRTKTVVYTI